MEAKTSNCIHRAAHTLASPVQDVGVNHGRPHVLMPEKLLDRSDVVSTLEKMGRERVSQCMALRLLDNASITHSRLHCFLDYRFINMIAPLLAGPPILPSILLRKHELLLPFPGGVWIVPNKVMRQLHLAVAVGQILFVDSPDHPQVFKQWLEPLFSSTATCILDSR